MTNGKPKTAWDIPAASPFTTGKGAKANFGRRNGGRGADVPEFVINPRKKKVVQCPGK